MRSAQLFTLAGLVIATSGYSSATTLSYYGLDPLQSTSIWMDVTYLPGDLMLSGQTASSQTKVTEEVGVGVMSVGFDGSLQLQDAFCVDRFAYIGTGNYNVNLAAPNTVANGEQAAWMLHSVLPQINAAPNVVDQQNMAAALQLAIWDVVHDNGDGFGLGRIQMSSSVAHPTDPIILSLAQSFVTQSTGQAYSNAYIATNVSTEALTQRLIVDGPNNGVPEPSTWALALSGLAFAAFRRAKRA